jgi:hypothetical protein
MGSFGLSDLRMTRRIHDGGGPLRVLDIVILSEKKDPGGCQNSGLGFLGSFSSAGSL